MVNGEADENRFYEQVGSSIRDARKEVELSQAQLARYLGMSRASIGNIEAGRQRIQLHVLAWIALHLNRSTHSLVPDAISTNKAAGMLPHEEAVFTDNSSQSFVEDVLRQARESS